MKRCKKCKDWQLRRMNMVQQMNDKGIIVKAKRLNDFCVCDIMNNRKNGPEDRELLIVK